MARRHPPARAPRVGDALPPMLGGRRAGRRGTPRRGCRSPGACPLRPPARGRAGRRRSWPRPPPPGARAPQRRSAVGGLCTPPCARTTLTHPDHSQQRTRARRHSCTQTHRHAHAHQYAHQHPRPASLGESWGSTPRGALRTLGPALLPDTRRDPHVLRSRAVSSQGGQHRPLHAPQSPGRWEVLVAAPRPCEHIV